MNNFYIDKQGQKRPKYERIELPKQGLFELVISFSLSGTKIITGSPSGIRDYLAKESPHHCLCMNFAKRINLSLLSELIKQQGHSKLLEDLKKNKSITVSEWKIYGKGSEQFKLVKGSARLKRLKVVNPEDLPKHTRWLLLYDKRVIRTFRRLPQEYLNVFDGVRVLDKAW